MNSRIKNGFINSFPDYLQKLPTIFSARDHYQLKYFTTMAKNKTMVTSVSVTDFINAIREEGKRKDSFTLQELFKKATGKEPKLWGPSIIGFGSYHYKYESGREGESPLLAFSPRAAAITIYLSGHFEKREELLQQLGKHKTEKGCIYIKKLDEINIGILQKMIASHILHIQKMYPDK